LTAKTIFNSSKHIKHILKHIPKLSPLSQKKTDNISHFLSQMLKTECPISRISVIFGANKTQKKFPRYDVFPFIYRFYLSPCEEAEK
jgi:hypothetical protein